MNVTINIYPKNIVDSFYNMEDISVWAERGV